MSHQHQFENELKLTEVVNTQGAVESEKWKHLRNDTKNPCSRFQITEFFFSFLKLRFEKGDFYFEDLKLSLGFQR